MTTIYHNFPSISVPLKGIKDHKTIIRLLKTSEQPTVNIQYNDNNYTAESLVICDFNDEVGTLGYLVIKCYQDPNDTESNVVYVALPLVADGNDAAETDIDAIINGIKSNSTLQVSVDIDSHIDDKNKCTVMTSANGGDFPATITFSKPIKLKQTNTPPMTFYASSNLSGLNIGQTKNAQTQKKDLDWVMTCELIGDDGNTKDIKLNVNPPTETIMTYFAMILLIVSGAYYAGPVFYKESGIQAYVAGKTDLDHFSVNVFVGINMFIASLLSLIYGLQNGMIFVFIGVSLILSFRAGTVGILSSKEVSENYDNKKWFGFYKRLFTPTLYGILSLFLLTAGISSMSTFIGLEKKMKKTKDIGFPLSLAIFVALIFAILIVYVKYIDPIKSASTSP